MNEVTTTEVTQEPVDTHKVKAVEYVNSHSMADIIDHLKSQYKQVEAIRTEKDERLSKYLNLHNRISAFIIECVKEDAVDIDDLKELADELNIELTKEIEVTFKVDVKFTATVPLDFDVDRIDESDFDVRVDYCGNDDDIEMNEEYVDTEDFEVSDDN